MTMNKKIFISGKITGEPIYECMRKFKRGRYEIWWFNKIKDVVYSDVIIPLELPGIYFGIPHAEAMKICLEALKECTHIYMLKDWKDSPGARIEHEWAKNNGLEIIYEE